MQTKNFVEKIIQWSHRACIIVFKIGQIYNIRQRGTALSTGEIISRISIHGRIEYKAIRSIQSHNI